MREDLLSLPRGRLAATYSIVACDSETSEIGVAVQSSYFSVGTVVSWAEPGVGAIATQSIVEVSYGPKGLALLAGGRTAREALDQLVAEDPAAALRQVGVVDAEGRVAAHTGAACVPSCAHAQGRGYSVQGNMLASDAVWQAMGPAFERARGDLAERLMAALEAAQAAGGDVRGCQSAALLVVSGERPKNAWEGRHVDLRVDDSARPLEQLRALLTASRAYALFDEARQIMGAGEIERALEMVGRALELRPRDPQFAFWTAVALANAGRDEEARRYFESWAGAGPGWMTLALRLRELGLYSGDPSLLEP
jgi:uncharacterized Ntn-hydrolase superfamily protein